MWAICNEIKGNENKEFGIQIEGDPDYAANKYNDHLLATVPKLLKYLIHVLFDWKVNANIKSIFLTPKTPDEISEIAKQLKNKHSSGYDEILTSIVKIAIPHIQNVLCSIINNSFKYGIFPDHLKIAVIIPLYKKGNPENFDNYRPISLLPGLSKIFEKAMYSRLTTFLKQCNIFNECEHGFLAGKSTQTAIFRYVQYILEHLKKGKIGLGMLLDLSKAYDCLDRALLMRKLEMYGARGNAGKWISPYRNCTRQHTWAALIYSIC